MDSIRLARVRHIKSLPMWAGVVVRHSDNIFGKYQHTCVCPYCDGTYHDDDWVVYGSGCDIVKKTIRQHYQGEWDPHYRVWWIGNMEDNDANDVLYMLQTEMDILRITDDILDN